MPHARSNAVTRKAVLPAGAKAAAIAFALLTGWGAAPPAGAEIVGKARVIDAQTLMIGGRIVRLFGIAAPRADETCGAGERTWACGREARSAAINRLHPHWVTCVERGPQPADGTAIAVCYLAGVGQKEVNAWLVAAGWARAERALAPEYEPAEAAARAAGRGLWRAAGGRTQ